MRMLVEAGEDPSNVETRKAVAQTTDEALYVWADAWKFPPQGFDVYYVKKGSCRIKAEISSVVVPPLVEVD